MTCTKQLGSLERNIFHADEDAIAWMDVACSACVVVTEVMRRRASSICSSDQH